jgi:YgiT-type zinc finger domain-containing protein
VQIVAIPADLFEDYMECLHRKGHMMRAASPFSLDRKGYHVSWEAIPAWVCTQCGEPCFASPQVAVIQKAPASLDQACADLFRA